MLGSTRGDIILLDSISFRELVKSADQTQDINDVKQALKAAFGEMLEAAVDDALVRFFQEVDALSDALVERRVRT